ncbi:MAG: hypothetical protein ABS81_16510 [Pseudonocardia sp. SCN 72-86]|nr:MAG: hypothetical protein ABS81_16510 [Pseudonocardia sp. SCN 72-86]
MTEIGLILLGVIVVGGLLAFFLLRTKRGGEPQAGPRTVADLVRLKAEESGSTDATESARPAAPQPAVAPKSDVVGTEGSGRVTPPAPVPAPAVAASAPAASGAGVSTPAGAAAAAGATAVAGAAAAAVAGRGATAGSGPAAGSAVGSAPAAAASPAPGLPTPRPRAAQAPPAPAASPATQAPATPAAAERMPEPELEPEAVPAGPVERGDVSPPWGRIPDGSLVLPAAGPVEPETSADQPDWRWLAPVGDRKPAARTAPTTPPAPAVPANTGAAARHAAGRSRPATVPGSTGAPAAGAPELPAPRPVARTVRLVDPSAEAAADKKSDSAPAAAEPSATDTPSGDAPTPITRAGRATAWFEPTRLPADDAAPPAPAVADKAPTEAPRTPTGSSDAPSVAAIVAGAAAAAGGAVVGLRPKSQEPAEKAPVAPTPGDAPGVGDGPGVGAAPKAGDAPKVGDAPISVNAPEVAEAPEAADAPEVAGAPEVVDAPASGGPAAEDQPAAADAPTEEPARADTTPAPAPQSTDAVAPVIATGASIASLATKRAEARAATPTAVPDDAPTAKADTDSDALAGFSDWADVDDSESDKSVERPTVKDPTPAFGLAAVAPATEPVAAAAEPATSGATGSAIAAAGVAAAAGLAGAVASRSTSADPTPQAPTAPAEPEVPAPAASVAAAPDANTTPTEPETAAASAAEGSGSVRFRVVGRDGEAVTGATVRLLDGRGQGLAEATSGGDGRGALTGPSGRDADGFVVVATAAGHQPTVTTITGEATGDELALVLATSSAVAGRVRDAAGRPVGGASVALIEEGEVVDSTRTAATGDYRIGDLPTGEYTIAVTAPRHDPAAVQVNVEPGATATHDVVLEPVAATLGG